MKKISLIICLSILTICTIAGLRIRRQQALSQQHIASQIIRLHVIANSDETADQTLKKEVKDQVVTYLRSKMNQATTIQAARQVICQEMDALKQIAEKKIRQEGYDYPVTVSLGTTYFPVKEYGDMAFPAGDYEALRVQIGESKGRNWWCVMYPSLCLVDGVYQTVPESSKDKLKQVLSTSEYQSLVDGGEDVQFRLRFLDWLF
ncbi:MAG: stage II sporulation protein R [Eubacterium sp.]|nr:stage II sporulation protein R [Eubacterium sp.]